MPNTLAHLGIQSLLTRRLLSNPDLKWVYVGCVVPDVAWILQRAAARLLSSLDLFDLRLYAIVQSSFVFCIVLSLTLALLASNPRRVFTILTLNSFLHLILDACETKWANGVHFLAPFSWTLTNWRLFWPESFPTYVLTALGLAFCLWQWKVSTSSFDICFRAKPKHILLAVLLLFYLTAPAVFSDGPYRADNHFLRTMKERSDRTNRYVEFDRPYCHSRGRDAVIYSSYGEQITLVGGRGLPEGSISVRGKFLDPTTVKVFEIHDHSGSPRDQLSYLGLGLIAAVWTVAAYRNWTARQSINVGPADQ
jgi:hypothetical protein